MGKNRKPNNHPYGPHVGKEDTLMNLDISRMFRNGLNLLIAVSGVLMCACATPPETRVDAEEKPTALEGKAPGTVVIKSVRTEATPHLTMVAFACSGAPAYGKPYAMTNPAR
jgi:hypothetical protein